MRFAANISTMFTDMDVVDRFNEAKEYGFNAVEAQFLYEHPLSELIEARTSVDIPIVILNRPKSTYRYPWWYETEPFGVACIIQNQPEFFKTINMSIHYCDYLGCRKLHIMAGDVPENKTFEECEVVFLQSLKGAVELLELYKVVGVIEPMCAKVRPNYFLNSFKKAVDYIKEIDSEYIRLLLDVYHLHNIEGNVDGLLNYLPYAAHIQVSQSPLRNEPLAKGYINYEKVFKVLQDNGYDGDIGLEYIPTGIMKMDIPQPLTGMAKSENPDFEWFKRFGH